MAMRKVSVLVLSGLIFSLSLSLSTGCELMDQMSQVVHQGTHLEDASLQEIWQEVRDRALDSVPGLDSGD